jgi:phage terminase small subunit
MSGPLRNTRHERFVALLLEGKSASAAYAEAGYTADDANGSRLHANPKIQARLAESQTEVAKETKISVESLLGELESARKTAVDLEQLSAAVRAIESKAKISGVLVQRVEIGRPGDFSHCDSIEEVADNLVEISLNHYHDFRPADRQALVEMCNRHTAETNAFIEAIKARPFLTNNPPPKRLTFGNGNGKARSEN